MPALGEDLTKTVKDALYITVGLGVIAFQRAQVQRQELRKQVEERLPEPARELVKQARETAKEARSQVRSRVGGNGVAA